MTQVSESLFPSPENMREVCASLRKQIARGGRAIDGGYPFTPVRDNVLSALIELYDRLDNSVVLEWDGDRDSTSFLFVQEGEAEDVQVTLTMSEWMDRGSPLAITVVFGEVNQ